MGRQFWNLNCWLKNSCQITALSAVASVPEFTVAWYDDSRYISQHIGKKKHKPKNSVVEAGIFSQSHHEDTEMKVLAEWRSLSSRQYTWFSTGLIAPLFTQQWADRERRCWRHRVAALYTPCWGLQAQKLSKRTSVRGWTAAVVTWRAGGIWILSRPLRNLPSAHLSY